MLRERLNPRELCFRKLNWRQSSGFLLRSPQVFAKRLFFAAIFTGNSAHGLGRFLWAYCFRQRRLAPDTSTKEASRRSSLGFMVFCLEFLRRRGRACGPGSWFTHGTTASAV